MLTKENLSKIENYSDEKRLQYLLKEAVNTNTLWLLTDEHGCMMLTSEDEDCIPIWPNEEFAKQWINNDWQHCKTESISLTTWFSRWTHGLIDDDLSVVVFPNHAQQGIILYPDELEFELKKQQKKIKKTD
jgi:hypothetical protein